MPQAAGSERPSEGGRDANMESSLCSFCGHEYIKKRVKQKYCSDLCQRRDSYRKNREQEKEYAHNYWKSLSTEKKKQYSKAQWKAIKENPTRYKSHLLLTNKATRVFIERNRKRILELYNYKCAICEFSSVIDIHHIDGSGQKDTTFNKPVSEYIVLCPNHHTMYHRGLISKERLIKFQLTKEEK
jgi:predicted restriction endonuclease